MKHIKKLSIFIPVLISLGLSGCGYFGSKLPESNLTQRERICASLKQKITFEQTNQSFTINKANANQLAQYWRSYRRYDCTNLEKQQ